METFHEDPRGVLVSLKEDAFAGYLYNVWFPYTKSNIIKIKEGGFVAVKNFQGLTNDPKYSILEIVSMLPVHYALGSTESATERAYPGFVVEAAKAARQDWEQEEPVEQTTKIRASAMPTGLQMVFSDSQCSIKNDESMPMIGEEVFLLNNEATSKIVNQGFTTGAVPHIKPCWLVQNKEIDVCVGTEALLRTHFGIFGFTGSGKSNLNSTIINELSNKRGLKIVLFDLMLEYTGLLIDLLVQKENAFVLSLDVDSLPGGDSMEKALRGEAEEQNAIDNITNTLLLPRELAPCRSYYKKCFSTMLNQNKFKILASGSELTAEMLYTEIIEKLPADNRLGNTSHAVNAWLARIQERGDSPITQDYIQELSRQIQDFIDQGIPETFEEQNQSTARGGQTSFLSSGQGTQPLQRPVERLELTTSARNYFLGVQDKLAKHIPREEEHPIKTQCTTSMSYLLRLLNDEENSALVIVQSNRDDDLREFSARLVRTIFNDRKRRGANGPQILFLYDEADEFMPSQTTEASSYGIAKSAITMLARRGRKFGLGLNFATQRVAYLDTSILAQAHTYLISKLPRQYDRETVSNAFGLSEDMLRRTLKFSKGQWLLVSYEATGLENVPLPVQFPNANERIKTFLEQFNSTS
jgi:hypothetical protein